MKKKKINKKGIILASALCGTFLVGSSLMYFADGDSKTNTITIGKVDIETEEPSWNEENSHVIEPLVSYDKDPTVRIKSGSADSYVWVFIEVPTADVKYIEDGKVKSGTIDLFTYQTNENWKMLSKTSQENSTLYVYGYTKGTGTEQLIPQSDGDTVLPPVFEKVACANIVEGQIPKGEEREIKVSAGAIQSTGFTSAQEAYQVFLKQQE